MLKELYNVFFGYTYCERCGSKKIHTRGYFASARVHKCMDCGYEVVAGAY